MTQILHLLYQALYRGFLSRLSEPAAVALGQAVLKLTALDRLPLFRAHDPRLAVTLGGVRLPNPLILSSMYYEPTILRRAMGLGFGAVTTKSITVNPRPGHPKPNLVRIQTASGPGFVNCNGFKNPGLQAYEALLPTLPHRVPLIVAVAGESVDDYVTLVERLAPYGDLVEFNISSPNTALVYQWSQKPEDVAQLFKAVRGATTKPLIVKLSPDFSLVNERALIPAAIEHGIEIVNYANARRVTEPRLSEGAGGLSGPELFSNTLASVARLSQRFGRNIEIIATGGVDSPHKTLALLRAGATACAYFTGFITRGPLLARQILDRLSQEIDRRGAGSVEHFRGLGSIQ